MTFFGFLTDLAKGPVMGACVALVGVWLTMSANKQIRNDERGERASDKLRDEVATLLADEQSTVDLANALIGAASNLDRRLDRVGSSKLSDGEKQQRFRQAKRDYDERCKQLRQKAARVSLYSNNNAVLFALDKLRGAQWSNPVSVLDEETFGGLLDAFDSLESEIRIAFRELESATWLMIHGEGDLPARLKWWHSSAVRP